MPRRAPAEPIDHHYNISKLNRVFAATGIVLTVVFVGMVVEDYSRGWKRIQRAFARIDARKAREAALAARRTALGEERARLRARMIEANRQLAAHRRELARLDRKLKDLAPQIYLADQQAKFTKASLDAQRYKYENALATAPRSASSQKRGLDELEREFEGRRLRLARLQQAETSAEAARESLVARREDVQTEVEKLTSDYRTSLKRLAGLQEDTIFKLRNSPILDMVNPSLRVQQVQLPDHFINVNFIRIPRIDP